MTPHKGCFFGCRPLIAADRYMYYIDIDTEWGSSSRLLIKMPNGRPKRTSWQISKYSDRFCLKKLTNFEPAIDIRLSSLNSAESWLMGGARERLLWHSLGPSCVYMCVCVIACTSFTLCARCILKCSCILLVIPHHIPPHHRRHHLRRSVPLHKIYFAFIIISCIECTPTHTRAEGVEKNSKNRLQLTCPARTPLLRKMFFPAAREKNSFRPIVKICKVATRSFL